LFTLAAMGLNSPYSALNTAWQDFQLIANPDAAVKSRSGHNRAKTGNGKDSIYRQAKSAITLSADRFVSYFSKGRAKIIQSCSGFGRYSQDRCCFKKTALQVVAHFFPDKLKPVRGNQITLGRATKPSFSPSS